ncbi:hypothetical protein [Azospirillum sp. TSO22-1]|uniref:hypothetical protein n=1 Tax=Azospirillum sp. TSO22-1 TaxID=716789 RepID=UPI000D61D5E6|nr:hypothetical protein [Azospirillum sp. TSO22-1]PWC45918.1 hypothetical protein TSO221_15310 [Azospirillum sp. TSO22-1]
MTNRHGPLVALLALLALLTAGVTARAEAPGSAVPLPRVALTLDNASVVVIAAHKKLYAFLDGLDDNAPVRGAAVQIATARTTLPLQEISPGIYVSGPYLPPAVRTPLTVSVALDGKTARGAADLVLSEVPDPGTAGSSRLGLRLFILALVAGAAFGLFRYLRPGAVWWWPGRAA